jgi:sulfopropanediol 3-dehydrogenase
LKPQIAAQGGTHHQIRGLPVLTLKAPAISEAGMPEDAEVPDVVARIIADVRSEGDGAVRRYSSQIDGWSPASFGLTERQIESMLHKIPTSTIDDISFAQSQVRAFAQRQRECLLDLEVETLPGVRLGHRNIPVHASAAYIPGGRYPLAASAHMTVVTAKVAGVERVAAVTPPSHGALPDVTVAAAALAGADEIYIIGGVQAVAALALGTETITPVPLITGPGNAYVAEAKRQLFGEVGIDLQAGPTEILIIADHEADPFTVAVDLLSQAEHGPDSPTVLITTSEDLGRAVLHEVDALLPGLPTQDMAQPAWRDHGEVRVVADLPMAYRLADGYASEHVEILTAQPREALKHMHNYGALFLGSLTTVSYGDKVIGTNHVLPTRGAARYTGGLWVGKYLKTVTYQEVCDPGASAALGEICGRLSRLENFEGHARAGDLRAARFRREELDWS